MTIFGLLPNDSTFDPGTPGPVDPEDFSVGYWWVGNEYSLDRVTSPTPVAGTGVMRATVIHGQGSLTPDDQDGPLFGADFPEQPYYVLPGDEVTFSAFVRVDPGNIHFGFYYAGLKISTERADGSVISTFSSSTTGPYNFYKSVNSTSWTQVSVTATMPAQARFVTASFVLKWWDGVTLNGFGNPAMQGLPNGDIYYFSNALANLRRSAVDCLKDEILFDGPTALWFPADYTNRLIPDISGNGYDLHESWDAGGFFERATRTLTNSTTPQIQPYYGNGTPTTGQLVLVLVLVTDSNVGVGPRPAYPTLGAPASGWTEASTFTFDHDYGGYLYACRASLFKHIAVDGENPDLLLTFPVVYSAGHAAAAGLVSYVLDSDTAHLRNLVVDSVYWGSFDQVDGNWPTIVPPALERYFTFNMTSMTHEALNRYDPIYFSSLEYSVTGSAFPQGGDYSAVWIGADWHDPGSTPPTRGWHHVGTSGAALALCTVVLTHVDAEPLSVTSDDVPFCATCSGQPTGALKNSTNRAPELIRFMPTATVSDLFGGDPHDFTLEALAKHGPDSFGGAFHVHTTDILSWYYLDYSSVVQDIPANAGCWHYAVLTYNSSSNVSHLWIDGVLAANTIGAVSSPSIDLWSFYSAEIAVLATHAQVLGDARISARWAHICNPCAYAIHPSERRTGLLVTSQNFLKKSSFVGQSARMSNPTPVTIRGSVGQQQTTPRTNIPGPNPLIWTP